MEFFVGARWALDSMITFGVKQVPTGASGTGIKSQTFWDTAEKLAKRELTGNDALSAIGFLRMKQLRKSCPCCLEWAKQYLEENDPSVI